MAESKHRFKDNILQPAPAGPVYFSPRTKEYLQLHANCFTWEHLARFASHEGLQETSPYPITIVRYVAREPRCLYSPLTLACYLHNYVTARISLHVWNAIMRSLNCWRPWAFGQDPQHHEQAPPEEEHEEELGHEDVELPTEVEGITHIAVDSTSS